MSAEESSPKNNNASVPAVEEPTSSAPAPADGEDVDVEEKPKSSSPSKKPTSSKPRGRPSTGASTKKATPSQNDDKSNYEVGDIVLARLRGYPPWPARIANPDTLPRNVLKQRPGKNPYIYCCQFFPAGDFSWLQSKEIKPLSSSDISSYLSEPHRKATGGLREAYQTAQDPTEWDSAQSEIQQAKEEADNNVDELEDEDEDAPSGGKRKRGAQEKKKPGKKAKTTKAKADDVEEEEEAPKSKAKSKPAAKPKPATAKGSKAPVSKPENQEPADDDPLATNPECVKVKDWRHKLQRAFLSKSLPSAEEMPSYDDLFKTIESYDSMTIDALQYSKIGKVMKKIMTLTEIPRNDDFKITDRASKLMHQWTDFIASSEGKPNGNGEAPTNGEKKEEEKTETKADDSEKATEEGKKMEVDA
ncbi:uncharacterized protein IL334_007222 [Kwoniella shivajii]|uniref:PWWP domain-containing protein n=1 Tax=Kwoniella shivajii TaxID=564305 RepID=A0ABZ1DC24_9TREE|nr:hypothetical protein IL334_007222 [Kwoniella shivajii]